MKILYAIQATGNGHISRAMELIPWLKEYGTVDLFLSGSNHSLQLEIPVKYRSSGLSLQYTCSGGLDYYKTTRSIEPLRLRREIRELPVEQYDLVLNDFEYITAAACKLKKIPSINFGHQASFQSALTPRPPEISRLGEFVLKNYAPATSYVGLHFQQYDEFIHTPIIKKEIRDAQPRNGGYITVYLPAYCESQLLSLFTQFPEVPFEIFSFQTTEIRTLGHITLLPVNRNYFNNSLINCSALITGGGFETPAEALHLGKKLMCIPIRGQYEQRCNAAALASLGVTVISKPGKDFYSAFYSWLAEATPVKMDYSRSIEECIHYLFNHQVKHQMSYGDTDQEIMLTRK